MLSLVLSRNTFCRCLSDLASQERLALAFIVVRMQPVSFDGGDSISNVPRQTSSVMVL